VNGTDLNHSIITISMALHHNDPFHSQTTKKPPTHPSNAGTSVHNLKPSMCLPPPSFLRPKPQNPQNPQNPRNPKNPGNPSNPGNPGNPRNPQNPPLRTTKHIHFTTPYNTIHKPHPTGQKKKQPAKSGKLQRKKSERKGSTDEEKRQRKGSGTVLGWGSHLGSSGKWRGKGRFLDTYIYPRHCHCRLLYLQGK